MPDLAQRIAENLAQIKSRMADASRRGGRDADAVKLVGVTKYVESPVARALIAAGCHDLGESRPQELWHKAEALADLPVRWHLVGHLQRNKIRRTLPHVVLIHSADSLRLLDALDREAAALSRRAAVLLEVNISGDASKHGFTPEELPSGLPQLGELAHLEIRGLMAMAALGSDADGARRAFAALRALRDRLQAVCPPSVSLEELSMGMSGDFEVAIEEGATIVRIGTALFEGVS